MKKVLISLAIGFTIFTGCAGVSDVLEKLPNKYAYVSESHQQRWIMKNPLSVDSNLYVPCKIQEYKFNKNYIIAKIKFHYDMNCVVGFEESKRLKEGKIYYYIIDTVKNVRYGEFDSYEKFNEKLKALNVGLSLDK